MRLLQQLNWKLFYILFAAALVSLLLRQIHFVNKHPWPHGISD